MTLLRPPRRDIAIAIGVAALGLLELRTNALISPLRVAIPAEMVAAGTLAWRRRLPLVATVVAMGALTSEWLLGVPVSEPVQPLFVMLILAFTLAVECERGRALAGAGVLVAGGVIGSAFASRSYGVGSFLFGVAWIAAAFVPGRLVRARNSQTRQLERANQQLARDREERARAAVADERARIAREMHDVIAHTISVMVVHAGAVRRRMLDQQDTERDALETIERAGREALDELRRLLGVLREDDSGRGLTPQPGMTNVAALVDQMRDSGLSVDLTVEGRERPLPPGVDVSAYRIVQEALTNTLKHAHAERASVTARYEPRQLNLEIVDDGSGNGTGDGTGHGLIGMRERVALYGGSLEAGPVNGGGFAVRARLPVEPGR